MSDSIDQSSVNAITGYDAEQRFDFLVAEVIANGELWVLTDELGSVMLNTDDEDCVPVWPGRAFAEQWATDEWSECEPLAIPLKEWNFRWTPGLEEDGFAVVVFPMAGEAEQDGLVVSPEELDRALTKALKASRG